MLKFTCGGGMMKKRKRKMNESKTYIREKRIQIYIYFFAIELSINKCERN